ncbi:pentatricopeptide repeat-containing protein At3g13880 [Aristolochia californica]|uniref:pentatricopeptide repeat-containing protein At3g13880 n=1 Tax=Aristolochia californica TaxID=171875 RepID=UPI0035DC5641
MQWCCCKRFVAFSEFFFFHCAKSFTTSVAIQNPLKLYPGSSIDSLKYTSLIQSFTKKGSLIGGKLTHAHMIVTSLKSSLFLLNNLLNLYWKCGDMDSATLLFDKMHERNVVSWNSVISGYSQVGHYDMALNLFLAALRTEVRLDKFTYACVLSVCAQSGDLKTGKIIHGLIVVGGFGFQNFVANSLIDMYSKCGRIDQARFLFDNLDDLDSVSWNSLISAYVRIGLTKEAFRVFIQMQRNGWNMNTYALSSVLKGCSISDDGESFGKIIHGLVTKVGLDMDVVVGGAILDMYAKVGRLKDAIEVFKLMPNHNLVAFNAMIAGFFRSNANVSDKLAEDALSLFSEILRRGMRPTKYTFSSILRACNVVEALEHVQQIHAQIIKYNLHLDEFIGSALIDLYTKMGSIEEGLRCFTSVPKQDIVCWTSMIAGYIRNGQYEEAQSLFYGLLGTGKEPDHFTVSSALSACANLGTSRSGEQLQGYALKAGFYHSTIVGNSQIWMYCKSGDFDSAKLTFKEMENHDLVSWSALICAHAQHGQAAEALSLYKEMETHDVVPNEVTFLGLLTACSHSGLVDEGFRLVECMKNDYGIDPNVKHLACLVDLLGRAGRLVDAEQFIATSSFSSDPVMWRALLGACRIHGDTSVGQRVANRVIELEPQASASYVLLYNLYMDAGKNLDANSVRDLMKERRVKKEPGLSWIDVGTSIHSFVVGDRSHPDIQLIYTKLEQMLEKIKEMGYISTNSSDDSDEQKTFVNHHSEKLAVAFGMIALPKLAPLRVMKNLRICNDCHTIMKFVSKTERRDIILRDLIRFHHFRAGSCSCHDYW